MGTAPLEKDLLLCCTHGTKDKCCTKYGYQTYKALAQTVADHQLPFEVWESRHLGGCRGSSQLTPAQQYAELAALTHLSTQLSTDQHQPQLALLDDSGSEQERLIRWQWQRGNTQGQLSVRC